jgi:hypothetical protein
MVIVAALITSNEARGDYSAGPGGRCGYSMMSVLAGPKTTR